MKPDTLRDYLTGSVDTHATLQWLQDKFLPLVVHQLNQTDSRKRLALYGGDRIPENERNLTDFRNRISLIIEYEFARTITTMLQSAKITDLFCAYVVANRFPDLEIRDDDGLRGLRFEVKCLQSTAEEKSANFATLRKDILPSTDFIVVFLWDWDNDQMETCWDRAPYVLGVYVFNASSLATLRDWYWLNSPPKNLGSGYQGFDIRFAVNCMKGQFNEEEGNYGKLLRLWKSNLPHRPQANGRLLKTEQDYLSFRKSVVESGFKTLAFQMLPTLSGRESVSEIVEDNQQLGFRTGSLAFLFSAKINNNFAKLRLIMKREGLAEVWLLRDKYQWRRYKAVGGNVKLITEGTKPKTIIENRLED